MSSIQTGAADAPPVSTLTTRTIAEGEDWWVGDIVCRAGPQDRPFEERHERVSIAAVVSGSFQYRSDGGEALLYPGALLLGNSGACFQCGHEHGVGDRCIAFQFEPALFEEVAASAAGSHRFRFPAAMLPAVRDMTAPLARIEAMQDAKGRGDIDEFAIRLIETVLSIVSGFGGKVAMPSAHDQRRIARALHYIEDHADQPLDLAHLASVAAMSKYHFLRIFRRIAGVTPYEYLLGLRMRRAAARLRLTPEPVSQIAFEAGFGDLSTFNARFRAIFGAPPSRYRAMKDAAP